LREESLLVFCFQSGGILRFAQNDNQSTISPTCEACATQDRHTPQHDSTQQADIVKRINQLHVRYPVLLNKVLHRPIRAVVGASAVGVEMALVIQRPRQLVEDRRALLCETAVY
jgi:hypothetical protein